MNSKTEVKHTPTPWEVSRTHSADWIVAAGELIAICEETNEQKTSAIANAAFIVRAVNSHEDLLGALKLANEKLIQLKVTNTGWPELNKVWEAIAQAEGK